MTLERLASMAMIALSIISAGSYAFVCDWRRAIYWIAAAVITASVTF